MSCANETCSTIVAESQTSPYLARYSSSVATPRYRVRTAERVVEAEGLRGVKPHILPDSTYADPQHVWGDEGPISEERETS